MKFGELLSKCVKDEHNSIKYINLEIESVEAQKLTASGSNNIIPSGFSAPLRDFNNNDGNNEDLKELEVLAIGIKDDSTLNVVI